MRTTKGKFRKWHNENYNFMTPTIHKLRKFSHEKQDYIIEIGTNRRKTMYGVSIFQHVDGEEFEKVDHELNKPFKNRANAMQYAQKLYKAVKQDKTEEPKKEVNQ